MSVERTAYDVLMVPASATAREIHLAYRGIARRFHPDGAEPDAARMVELNAAYDELKTPERRLAYDRQIRTVARARGPRPADAAMREAENLGPLGRRVAAARGVTPVLDFGPYAGLCIAEVAVSDSDYLRWLSSQAIASCLRDAIVRCLAAHSGSARRPFCAR